MPSRPVRVKNQTPMAKQTHRMPMPTSRTPIPIIVSKAHLQTAGPLAARSCRTTVIDAARTLKLLLRYTDFPLRAALARPDPQHITTRRRSTDLRRHASLKRHFRVYPERAAPFSRGR
jgi:hypothetical protein